jgi:glycosyltransferase involved in cell wall biosynthesis
MSNYSVSIVVTAYDLEDGVTHSLKIQNTIDSDQVYEIIIVCLTDVSNILIGCQQKVVLQKGSGLYSAMNIGFVKSVYEWVYYSNPGDRLIQLPKYLNDKLLAECFPVCVCGSDGAPQFVRHPGSKGIMPPHQGTFYHRRNIKKHFGFMYREDLFFAGDLDLYLRLKDRVEFHYYPTVSEFKLGGISNQKALFLKRKLERFKVLSQYFNFFRSFYKTFIN